MVIPPYFLPVGIIMQSSGQWLYLPNLPFFRQFSNRMVPGKNAGGKKTRNIFHSFEKFCALSIDDPACRPIPDFSQEIFYGLKILVTKLVSPLFILDVPSSTPAVKNRSNFAFHCGFLRLATIPCEKSGLFHHWS